MKKCSKPAIIALTVFFVICTGITGCLNREIDTKVVRIACFPNITHSQALLGKENKFFEKYIGSEYSIDWKIFNAGPAEIEAFFAGELDLGYIGPVPAINACEKSNGDIQILAGATQGGALLVAGKSSNIHNVAGLTGKKVAIPQFGNTQDLCLRYLLKKNNLKDTATGGTVVVVAAENSDIKNLLSNGDIDAALVPEPWAARLIVETGAKIILDVNEVFLDGNYPSAVLIGRTKFIAEHPDIVENVLRAHIELTRMINKNEDNARTRINSRIKEVTHSALSQAVLDMSFSHMTAIYDPKKNALTEFAGLMFERGLIKSRIDINKIVNMDILNRVAHSGGEKAIN
ncbi:MAG: aliphatic sulfonate ABC transporter substrate-binding protein [Bacillota bacterium]